MRLFVLNGLHRPTASIPRHVSDPHRLGVGLAGNCVRENAAELVPAHIGMSNRFQMDYALTNRLDDFKRKLSERIRFVFHDPVSRPYSRHLRPP